MFSKQTMPEARPVNYVGVDSVDSAIEKFKQAGGTMTVPKQEVPGTGWTALGVDPEGKPWVCGRVRGKPSGVGLSLVVERLSVRGRIRSSRPPHFIYDVVDDTSPVQLRNRFSFGSITPTVTTSSPLVLNSLRKMLIPIESPATCPRTIKFPREFSRSLLSSS